MSAATAALVAAWGARGAPISIGWSPGRCTLVGEHVDYAGGVIVAIAVDLGVEVAVRESADAAFHIVSRGRVVERSTTAMCGDIGDRILAAVEVLRRRGMSVPGLDVGVAATLPESSGLSSSAAIVCATLLAVLRHSGDSLSADAAVALALSAERDIVGVPCGPLDQLTVVHAPREGAVVLGCSTGGVTTVGWPFVDVGIVACATGDAHDVGGAGYRSRRDAADAILGALGITSIQAAGPDAATSFSGEQARRANHLISGTARAVAATSALSDADARRLGELMTASHRSLRDDYDVSTPALDAAVDAALSSKGCFGARLVGAGFGGTAIALVDLAAAARVRTAMAGACAVDRAISTWAFHPSPGIAVVNPDVLAGASA